MSPPTSPISISSIVSTPSPNSPWFLQCSSTCCFSSTFHLNFQHLSQRQQHLTMTGNGAVMLFSHSSYLHFSNSFVATERRFKDVAVIQDLSSKDAMLCHDLRMFVFFCSFRQICFVVSESFVFFSICNVRNLYLSKVGCFLLLDLSNSVFLLFNLSGKSIFV